MAVDLENQRSIAARVPHLGDLHDRVTAGVENVDAPAGLGVGDGDLVAADLDGGGQGRDLGLFGFGGFGFGLWFGYGWLRLLLMLDGLRRAVCVCFGGGSRLRHGRWRRGVGEHGVVGEQRRTVHGERSYIMKACVVSDSRRQFFLGWKAGCILMLGLCGILRSAGGRPREDSNICSGLF